MNSLIFEMLGSGEVSTDTSLNISTIIDEAMGAISKYELYDPVNKQVMSTELLKLYHVNSRKEVTELIIRIAKNHDVCPLQVKVEAIIYGFVGSFEYKRHFVMIRLNEHKNPEHEHLFFKNKRLKQTTNSRLGGFPVLQTVSHGFPMSNYLIVTKGEH